MRVLLASSASYAPPRGGSTRSNLAWLRELAARGHQCRVIGGGDVNRAWAELEAGIQVAAWVDPVERAQALTREVPDWKPDWVLVSSEDLSHTLLRAAARAANGRLVYLAHTPQFFPFGPESWNADELAAAIVRDAAGVVAISQFVADYVKDRLQIHPAVIHPPIYGRADRPHFSNFDRGAIGMVNPCAVKGLGIFLGIAKHLPNYDFAALRGWGTTREDEERIGLMGNISLIGPVRDIDEFLAQTRVLLMPSIWMEGFGLIVMEAMLRGIPVVASDSGGLAEAKQGTRFIIPVNPVTSYEPAFDENHLPRPVAGEQAIEPWVEALQTLSTDRAEYEAESARSLQAARQFTAGLREGEFERYLSGLQAGRASSPASSPPALSPARRALLEKLLRDKGSR